jgi:hypothetical protein
LIFQICLEDFNRKGKEKASDVIGNAAKKQKLDDGKVADVNSDDSCTANEKVDDGHVTEKSANDILANGHDSDKTTNGDKANGHVMNGATNGDLANGHVTNGATNGDLANGHVINGTANGECITNASGDHRRYPVDLELEHVLGKMPQKVSKNDKNIYLLLGYFKQNCFFTKNL